MSTQGSCATCHAVLEINKRGLGTILCPACEALWYNTKFKALIEAYRERVAAPKFPTG